MVSKIGPKTIFLSIFTLLLFILLWTSSSKVGLADGVSFTITTTSDFDAGAKYSSDGNYEIETNTDNPSIPADQIQLTNKKGDKFNLTDSDADTWKWTITGGVWTAPPQGDTIRSINVDSPGKLRLGITNSNGSGDLVAYIDQLFTGDFEAQIKVDRITGSESHNWQLWFAFLKKHPDYDRPMGGRGGIIGLEYSIYQEGYSIKGFIKEDWTTIDSGYYTTSDSSIAVKVKKTGSTITVYYDLDADRDPYVWTELASANVTWDSGYVTLLARHGSTYPDVVGDFDNFQITSATFTTGSYRISGDWLSDTISMTLGNSLFNTTIYYSGVSSSNYIDKIEWLVNGVVEATYDTNIISDNSKTIKNSDLTSGSFNNVDQDFKIKVYLVGSGTGSPSVSKIEGSFTAGQEPGDTTPPTVSVSHSPSSPTNLTSVTITATASDNVGVTEINIYIDSSQVKTCSSSPCSTTSQIYSIGTHTYYATASDAANNIGRDPTSGTKSFTVQEEAPPEENEYSDFALSVEPQSITDSQVGEVVTVTTDEYDLVVDWSGDKFVIYKIKPKFTTDFIKYKRTTGAWNPGTEDEFGNDLDDSINTDISSWGRNGNIAWFYESCSEFSLNHTFTFYRDYFELDVHYKPGTKNVLTTYIVGTYDSSDNHINPRWGSGSTLFSPGASVEQPSSHGMGGWYPRGYFFAPVFDWRVPTSDTSFEWGYSGFSSYIWSPPSSSDGFSNIFSLIFTSVDSVVPHVAAGTEEDFHMFVRPYQANDGKKQGYAKAYAQWIGPKLAAEYQSHSTHVFPLTAMKSANWDSFYKNWIENSEIKIAVYSGRADQINWNYNSAAIAEPDSLDSTPENIPDDWELWYEGVGIPLTAYGGKAVLNPVVDDVRHNLIYEHDYMSWLTSSKGIFWDEVNIISIYNKPRHDYHYWDDYILEGYLKLIQESYDSGYWDHVYANPWLANLHVCYVADACTVEGYYWSSYGWVPNFVNHVHSTMMFVNNIPEQYRPTIIVYGELNANEPDDLQKAYRLIWGSAKYGFHITIVSFVSGEDQMHIFEAAENMFKAMGCSKNDDSCITNNAKRNQVATMLLDESGTLTTNARMVVFAGGIVVPDVINNPDITFTTSRNDYTFTNLRNATTSLKITIPSTNLYVSESNDLIVDSSTIQGSNQVIEARILAEKTARIISNETLPCQEDWTCTAWSDCVDGTQTRTCTDNNACGTTTNKPSESQACGIECIEDWTCGEWSDCVDSTQTRVCTDNNNCGTVNDKPYVSQTCEMCVESWLCTEWSDCVDSTQTRVCTDNNVCGTTELKPHESQACEEIIVPLEELIPTQGATPTGPSGIMGSASAGGAVSSRVVTPTIAYEEEITYEFRNHPIYEVTFITLIDISDSKVSVENLGSIRPTRASIIPDGLIYRYVDLKTSNIEEQNTESIRIRLRVPILFYTENDIDPRRTKLQRWTGSDWDVLNTSQIGSDETYYYFRTLSDSLSLFAITAELTGISSPSTTCNKFCEEGEVLNIDTCECIPLAVTPGGIMLDYETFTYIVTFVSAFIIVLILHRVYRRYREERGIEKVMEKA